MAGTATGSGVDYTDPLTVTIPAGTYNSTAVAITGLSVRGDTLIESDETIDLGTLTGSQIRVGDANGDGTTQAATQYTIIDDEVPSTAVRSDAASNLTIQDVVPGGKADRLALTIVGDRLFITDLNNLVGDYTDNTTGSAVSVALASILSIEIDLLEGDDQLSIDFSGAPAGFNLPVTINGGGGLDTLIFSGPTPLGSGDLTTNDEVEDIFVNGPITTQRGSVTLKAMRDLEVNANIITGAGGEVRLTATEHDIFGNGNCSLIDAGDADVTLVSGTGIAGLRVKTTGDVNLDGGSGGIVGCPGQIASGRIAVEVSAATLKVMAKASVGTALLRAGQVTNREPLLTSVDAVRGTVGGLGIFLLNDRPLTDDVVLVGHAPAGIRDIRSLPATGSPAGEGSPFQNAVNRLDVNNDGAVSPVDVLGVVNYLNGAAVNSEGSSSNRAMMYVDVNGDYSVSPVDALTVINYLNPLHSPAAEGESSPLGQLEMQRVTPPSQPLTGSFTPASTSARTAARREPNEARESPSSLRSIPRAAQFEPAHTPRVRLLAREMDHDDLEQLLSQIAPDVDAAWSKLGGTAGP